MSKPLEIESLRTGCVVDGDVDAVLEKLEVVVPRELMSLAIEVAEKMAEFGFEFVSVDLGADVIVARRRQ